MANLFKAAKSEPKASSKPQKQEVLLKDKHLERQIARLAEINAQMDSLKAEAAGLSEEVKTVSVEEFIRLYKDNGKYPGSFNLRAGESSLMVVPTDRYININEDRFNELKDIYGEEMVEEKNTYIMDSAMVEKYGEVISDLILKSKKISVEDKKKLIYVETSYMVRKGTINVLLEKFRNFSITTLIEDIRPVFQLKNVNSSK
jgi:hypothetical protein